MEPVVKPVEPPVINTTNVYNTYNNTITNTITTTNVVKSNKHKLVKKSTTTSTDAGVVNSTPVIKAVKKIKKAVVKPTAAPIHTEGVNQITATITN